MTKRVAGIVWVGVAACGSPTPESVCEQIRALSSECASSESYSYTDDSLDACASSLSDCSDDDLEALDNYLDCLEGGCDTLSCYDELGTFDLSCMGYTGSGPGTTSS